MAGGDAGQYRRDGTRARGRRGSAQALCRPPLEAGEGCPRSRGGGGGYRDRSHLAAESADVLCVRGAGGHDDHVRRPARMHPGVVLGQQCVFGGQRGGEGKPVARGRLPLHGPPLRTAGGDGDGDGTEQHRTPGDTWLADHRAQSRRTTRSVGLSRTTACADKRTWEVGVMAAVSRQRVRDVLEPVVTGAGFDLEDVNVTAAGRRSVVRVIVDRDGGIELDAVAEIPRLVPETLDADDATGDSPYTLEVTSPGVDRPLTEPRHWRRAAGRLVRATVRDGKDVPGRVAGADDAGVTFDVDGTQRTVSYDALGPGKVQVEFSRPGASGADEEGDA